MLYHGLLMCDLIVAFSGDLPDKFNCKAVSPLSCIHVNVTTSHTRSILTKNTMSCCEPFLLQQTKIVLSSVSFMLWYWYWIHNFIEPWNQAFFSASPAPQFKIQGKISSMCITHRHQGEKSWRRYFGVSTDIATTTMSPQNYLCREAASRVGMVCRLLVNPCFLLVGQYMLTPLWRVDIQSSTTLNSRWLRTIVIREGDTLSLAHTLKLTSSTICRRCTQLCSHFSELVLTSVKLIILQVDVTSVF